MRLLVFGGSVFLSREVAAEAVRRGHEVTCACRGESGGIPDGARHLRIDRAVDDHATAGTEYDVVVDVARTPSWVRAAVAAIPDAHWIFVSTINVYPDTATTGGGPRTLPLHEPLHEDSEDLASPEDYGRMKVACEQSVQAGAAGHLIVRPGLIVGPGDPTGRFTYWPDRLARVGDGGEVLTPGRPDDRVQVIDVRDLAAWLVTAAERRLGGVYDAVGPVERIADLLGQVADGVGVRPSYTWVDQEFLLDQKVGMWSGERSLPLWLPRPEYDGIMTHYPTPALAAGLTLRPVEETARDTLAWRQESSNAARTGLTIEEEVELLQAWHTLHG